MKKLLLTLILGALVSCVDDGAEETTAGTTAGTTGATVAGTPAGMTAGMTAGTPAGMTAGTPAGMTTGATEAGTPAGMTTGATEAGTPAGMTTGATEAGTPAGMPAGMTGATEAGMPAGMPAGMTGATEAGMMNTSDCSAVDATTVCSTTIYNVRQGNVADDALVQVEGVVTATRNKTNGDPGYSHIVIQDPAGGSWSGMWIYMNNVDAMVTVPSLNPGDKVRLTGQVNTFYDQKQVEKINAFEVIATSSPIAPLTVTADEVKTMGTKAAEYEGMLVEINNVSVTAQNPMAGPGDQDPNNEFVVTGDLRINDYLYTYTLPEVGANFSAITGILRLGNNDFKIEPRNAEDLQSN